MKNFKAGDLFVWTGTQFDDFVNGGLFRVLTPFNSEFDSTEWEESTDFFEHLLGKKCIEKVACGEVFINDGGTIGSRKIG